jgi:hypothetical protein
MSDIDAIVASVMREMGCDPSAPPRWIPQEYNSVTGFKVPDGFVCSFCGKHSLAKRKVCDGCQSTMRNGR